MLSNLEDILSTWLDLQSKFKTLNTWYENKENQKNHPEEFEKFNESKLVFNQLIALGLFTNNMKQCCLSDMFQFALSEFQENMKVCWDPYYRQEMTEEVQKERSLQDEIKQQEEEQRLRELEKLIKTGCI